MMNINQVTLVGRLAEAVSYSEATEKTASRAIGRLIVNRPPSRSGQSRYDAITIVGWDKIADNMAKFTGKGKEVGITGRIVTNSVKKGDEWQNFFEVRVESISFGRDSNQVKMMKAFGDNVQTGEEPVAANQFASELLRAHPQLKDLLTSLVKGNEAGQKVVPAEETEEELLEAADQPFTDI